MPAPDDAARPSLADASDLFASGARWCANNQIWYQVPPGTVETACGGCGQPCPPPVPVPAVFNPDPYRDPYHDD